MTSGQFVVGLVDAVPEMSTVVEEHLADNDEVLLHLLMADVLRYAVASWHGGDRALTARVLDVVDAALREGDEQVQNAVCLSFVEDVGMGQGETPEFIASWPAALAAEHHRQTSG